MTGKSRAEDTAKYREKDRADGHFRPEQRLGQDLVECREERIIYYWPQKSSMEKRLFIHVRVVGRGAKSSPKAKPEPRPAPHEIC